MSCQVLIAAVATVAAMLPGPAGAGPASAQSGQQPDLAGYDLGVAAAVRSDLGASVRLPDGGQVYLPLRIGRSARNRSNRRSRIQL
jgi:hypothetical protein